MFIGEAKGPESTSVIAVHLYLTFIKEDHNNDVAKIAANSKDSEDHAEEILQCPIPIFSVQCTGKVVVYLSS